MAPRQILTRLRQEQPETSYRLKDVCNVVLEDRVKRLSGLTPVERLIKLLKDPEKYIYNFVTDSRQRRTHLFFIYKKTAKVF
jgi:hypothetical protein